MMTFLLKQEALLSVILVFLLKAKFMAQIQNIGFGRFQVYLRMENSQFIYFLSLFFFYIFLRLRQRFHLLSVDIRR